MTGQRNIKGSRSHAGSSRRSRIADWFRGHPDLPEMHPAPVMDLQHDDGMDVADAVEQQRQRDERQARPPWGTAPQPVIVPDSADSGYRGQTLTDPRTPDGRPFAPGPLFTPDRMTPLHAPVETDLDELPWFRDIVRAELVRRERAQGRRSDGNWRVQYARTWHEHAEARRAASRVPLLDFALHRWDGIVSEIVAQSAVKAEEAARADRAARNAAAAASLATCPEYTGRHSTGTEAVA